jgi:hypothetical protein
MRRGRPKSTLLINDEGRAHLLSIVRARSLPSALTERARIVLACENERSNKAVAADLGVGPHTIGKWRNRFITHRLEGLYDELRSEFLAFLRHIEANVLTKLDIHLIVDNYATHKHPKVKAWLARRPRWHLHFTPTYAS